MLSKLKVVSSSKRTEASLMRTIYSNPQIQLDIRCKAKFYCGLTAWSVVKINVALSLDITELTYCESV